jgi:excisionase family DNA binding protein
MAHSFLTSLNESEFKAFLREALTEILQGITPRDRDQEVMTIQEAAQFLRLQVSTLYEKTSQRSIPHSKKGNKLYFYRPELEAWLSEGKVKTSETLRSEAVTLDFQRRPSRHENRAPRPRGRAQQNPATHETKNQYPHI